LPRVAQILMDARLGEQVQVRKVRLDADTGIDPRRINHPRVVTIQTGADKSKRRNRSKRVTKDYATGQRICSVAI